MYRHNVVVVHLQFDHLKWSKTSILTSRNLMILKFIRNAASLLISSFGGVLDF